MLSAPSVYQLAQFAYNINPYPRSAISERSRSKAAFFEIPAFTAIQDVNQILPTLEN